MAPRTLIEHVATRYRQLDSLGSAIEKNILNNEFAPLPEMCAQLNTLQEEAKALDSELLDVLRQRQDLRELDITQEWLQLIQRIQDRNQRLVPHIRGIAAMQRIELQRLKKGNVMLQGYKPGTAHTGKRISSSG